MLSSPEPRIKAVPHGIREQIGREHEPKHEYKGSDQGPPDERFSCHLEPRAVDHVAPADHAGIDADIDIGQYGFGQDQAAEVKHHSDQHNMHDIGEDMPDNDSKVPYPEGMGGLNIIDLTKLERLPAQKPTQTCPACDSEDYAKEQQAHVCARF